MNIDLTPIVQAIICLLAALVTYKVIPWITANTDEKQQAALMTATSIAIFAAEQLYGAGKGAEKLQYVVDELEKKGFTADIALIEATIKDHIVELHTGKPTESVAVETGQ